MSQLDDDAKLFEDIFNSHKWICPVCKKEMSDEEEGWVWALRIRKTSQNVAKYSNRLLIHPFNGIWVDSNVCAERVSRSWESSNAEEKKSQLISEIKEDIERFEMAVQNTQMALYAPTKKKRKK